MQKLLDRGIDSSRINHIEVAVELKLRIAIGWIKNMNRSAIDAGMTEIASDFLRRRHRVNHGIGHGVPEAFIVHEEECLIANNWATERCAKIVLHHVIVSHVVERRGIHESIAQEFVNRSVILIAPAACDNVDLSAARAAHFRRVASGLHFKFLHRIRRRA